MESSGCLAPIERRMDRHLHFPGRSLRFKVVNLFAMMPDPCEEVTSRNFSCGVRKSMIGAGTSCTEHRIALTSCSHGKRLLRAPDSIPASKFVGIGVMQSESILILL